MNRECYSLARLLLVGILASSSSVVVVVLYPTPASASLLFPSTHAWHGRRQTLRRYSSSVYSQRKSNVACRMTDPQETDPLIPRQPTWNGKPNDDNTANDATEFLRLPTTGQKILDLAIPAAGALLMDPLMTLADTAFVGRFSGGSGSDPLAGMGSAAALLTFCFYLFNFLCTATTPLVARERAAGQDHRAVQISGQVLSLSLILGSLLTVLLWIFAQPLLRIMGTESTGETANGYALAFLSVRALAAPAVLCIEASVGVLRGYLDTKTPIVVLVVANTINLVLDVVLIVLFGLGPMGAAIATTTAEWVSAGLFLAVLAGRLPSAMEGPIGRSKRENGIFAFWEKSVAPEIAGNADNNPDSTPMLVNRGPVKVSIVPALAIPSWDEVRPLFQASSSVFFRALILQFSLSAAAAMAARGGLGGNDDDLVGVVAAATATSSSTAAAVAAHQIGIQLWLLCSFFCDSLAAASQGLVADAIGRNDNEDVVNISRTIFTYSLILGLFLAAVLQLGSSTHWLINVFTEDPAISVNLNRILPLIIVAQPLNALVFAADGVLQGAAEFPFQASAMVVSGATAVATFFALEAMGSENADALVHVWSALIALQFMRGLTSLWKLLDRNGPINLLSLKPNV